jgi:hypothetical protein
MRKFVSVAAATAVVATLLPASAFAGDMKHRRHVRAEAPVYAAAVAPAPNPLAFVLGGAAIGAIVGAAICPPCSIAGSALTSGGGALLGGGIGAITGGVVATAVSPQVYTY